MIRNGTPLSVRNAQPPAGPGNGAQTTAPATQRVVFRIMGFDRLRFVNEIANAVPQDGQCRITKMAFEGDGVRVIGWLIVDVPDQGHISAIHRQMQTVGGVVGIQQTN